MPHDYSAWTRYPKIPKALKFPGGFLVPIYLVPRPWLVGKEVMLPADADAIYDTDRGIFLWEGLTPKQRWHRLSHESIHANVDWQRWIELKTKRG